MLLKYVLSNERTSWSGSLIYRRFAQLNPWRSEQSWRNRFVKYMKRHVENFLLTGSIDSSAPGHIAQAIRDEFAPAATRPANRAPTSEQPRVKAPPLQPVARDNGDSDDEMFRDDRPAQFSDSEEEDEPQPFPIKRQKIAILEKSSKRKEPQQREEASPEAEDETPLFYGSQSPLTSPYNTTTEQGAVPSSAEEISSSLPSRSQGPVRSRVRIESRDSIGRSSPSLGSPTYYSTAPSA